MSRNTAKGKRPYVPAAARPKAKKYGNRPKQLNKFKYRLGRKRQPLPSELPFTQNPAYTRLTADGISQMAYYRYHGEPIRTRQVKIAIESMKKAQVSLKFKRHKKLRVK